MEAHIVVGAGFGDEGKGNFVNYLCSTTKNPIVIRFSGGQQAGHTVIHNGLKHVFSNYCSGALQGINSYFAEDTSFYLNTIVKEKKVLEEKGISPNLYVHPLAKMTTPYDVAYGKAREKELRHGSCGLGIGSTMTRHNDTGYKLYAVDLLHKSLAIEKLINISKYYDALAFKNSKEFYENYKKIEKEQESFFITNFNNDLPFEIVDYRLLSLYDTLIFEGSQGIMLDQNHGIFPNVTYANTTSKNALDICKKIDANVKEIYYITRSYQTRHGNGWMSSNFPINITNNDEEINTPNSWQGSLRTTKLDIDLIKYALTIDRAYHSQYINKHLVVTCLDQIKDSEEVINDLLELKEKYNLFNYYVSKSPESTKIQLLYT